MNISAIRRYALHSGLATIGHLVGKLVSVIIPFVVLASLPIGATTDLFFLFLAVAFFFNGTIANALTDATVPLVATGKRADIPAAWKYGLFVLGLAAISGVWFTELNIVTKWVYSAAFIGMAYAGIASAAAVGSLYASHRYLLPGLLWLFRLLPLGIWLIADKSWFSLGALMLGLAVADAARALILQRAAAPMLSRLCVDPDEVAHRRHYLLILLLSMLAGVNPLIDRMLANLAGAGSISILETADRIYGAFANLSTIGPITVLLTVLSVAHQEQKLNANWTRLIGLTIAWGILCTALGVIFVHLLVPPALSHHTQLTADQISQVTLLCKTYLFGLPGLMLILIHVRRYIATTSPQTLLGFTFASVFSNSLLGVILVHQQGVWGLAIAHAITNTIVALAMTVNSTLRSDAIE